MDLDDWRSRINNLDAEILKLLNQRGHAALQIGDLKRQQDRPYYVPEREAEVLDRVSRRQSGPTCRRGGARDLARDPLRLAGARAPAARRVPRPPGDLHAPGGGAPLRLVRRSSSR